MNAVIDRDNCIGCGLCAATCPDVFRMADDGLAEAYAPVTPETETSAQEAANDCPVNVIHIEK
ncbi:ferredoxin [Lachnospiraceae bacterium PF1-21]